MAAKVVDPDTQLVEMGREFARLYAQWRPLWWDEDAKRKLWEQTLTDRRMTFRTHGVQACLAVMDEVGATAAGHAAEEVLAPLNQLAERIMAIQPQSIVGLAVWAKVARFNGIDAEEQDKTAKDIDWSEESFMTLICQIEHMAGLPHSVPSASPAQDVPAS